MTSARESAGNVVEPGHGFLGAGLGGFRSYGGNVAKDGLQQEGIDWQRGDREGKDSRLEKLPAVQRCGDRGPREERGSGNGKRGPFGGGTPCLGT